MSLTFYVTTSFLLNLILNNVSDKVPGNLTDLSICKLSHLGLEYMGSIAKTESEARCQSWSSNTPHKVSDIIDDKLFPDGSKKSARNYCRNPTNNPLGPWCYTMSTELSDETCGIPLCTFTECKLTGPGIEYAGKHNKGFSDRNCLKWNKKRKKVKSEDKIIEISKFPKTSFPELSLSDAGKFCRNPDGDAGGPWCFIENEDSNEIEKEYCDIPFCDEPDCFVFTQNHKLYSHYTHFDGKNKNFTFGVKIWDSDNYINSSARLILSVLSLPLEGREIDELGIGIEVYLSNTQSALTFGNKDTPEFENTPHILTSSKYTTLTLSWSSGFITLEKEGTKKPIFLAEIKTANNLMGFRKDEFYYFATRGTNILWNFPVCQQKDCQVHKTAGVGFQQFRLLRDNKIGRELNFFVRAVNSARLFLSPNPVNSYPNVEITFQNSAGYTRVVVTKYKGGPRLLMKETTLMGLLDFWKWHEFTISFFSDTVSLYFKKATGNHEIFQLKNEAFRLMRWFSIDSETGEAHWTFFCKPLKEYDPPPPFLPECALNVQELEYEGTQDVTNKGVSCLPWSGGDFLFSGEEYKFSNGKEVFEAWNYCRDPNNEQKGTFCYTIARNGNKRKVEKTFCSLRKCKSAECKIAGTGNDYIGKINFTRTNRTCQNWDSAYPVHAGDESFKNDTLFAEQSISGARNYCRNPSRDLSGSWCYTTDSLVEQDVCNIRDCDKPEEWTLLVHGRSEGNKVYILPHWKERGIHGGLRIGFKQWNPDLMDGFFIEIFPLYGDDRIELGIGLRNNEKVILTLNNVNIKEATYPHLISSGKWTNLWLQMRKGEILLGFEGIPDPLFEWHNEQNYTDFEPTFLNYGCVSSAPVGVFVNNNEECHTENVTTGFFTKKYPVGLWSKTEQIIYNSITFYLRGTGTFVIAFFKISYDVNNIILLLDSVKNSVQLGKQTSSEYVVFNESNADPDSLFDTSSWTRYDLSFNEQYFKVSSKNRTIFNYNSPIPLIFYWFSVGTSVWVAWSANCEPVDIGAPRDGGWSSWSPWTCTVTCGGGEGFRTRTCSNPKPNIFGKLCEGPPIATGKCNDFECGDISPKTLESIHKHLQTKSNSYSINESGTILINNEVELLKNIAKESPHAYYEWTLNGLFIKPEKDHVTFRGDDILLENVNFKDSGVYVCMVYRINKKRIVIRVVSLAVHTKKPTVVSRETRTITLTCNSIVLGYIYSELSMKWLINSQVYEDYGVTMLVATDSVKLTLNSSHNGQWECIIEQRDLGLMWTPKYVTMVVKQKPNIYTNLMEDELTAPLFGWLETERNVKTALVLIVVFVIACVIVVLFLYFKFCTLKQRHYRKNRRL